MGFAKQPDYAELFYNFPFLDKSAKMRNDIFREDTVMHRLTPHTAPRSARRKLRSNRGFTLTELLAAVAILVVLMGIGVAAILGMTKNTKISRLDNTARELYLYAQSELTSLKTSGGLEGLSTELAGRQVDPCDLANGDDKGRIYYVDSTVDASAGGLVGSLLDDWAATLAGGSFIIELDPATGDVYSVFYTEETDITSLYTSVIAPLTDRSKDSRKAARPMLGYFNGELTDSTAGKRSGSDGLPETFSPTLTVYDGEELYLQLQSGTLGIKQIVATAAGEVYTENLSYLKASLKISDESGHTAVVELTCDSGTYDFESDTYTEYYLLDSAACPMSDNDDLKDLNPGDNLSVSLELKYEKFNVRVKGSTGTSCSSLFGSTSVSADGKTVTANISCLRHLNNIRYYIPRAGVNKTVFIQTGSDSAILDLDFTERTAKEYTVTKNGTSVTYANYVWDHDQYKGAAQPSGITSFTPLTTTSSYTAEYRSNGGVLSHFVINGASGAAGLFGEVTNWTFTDVALVDPVVIGTNNVGALAGKMTNCAVTGCGVHLEVKEEYYSQSTDGESLTEEEKLIYDCLLEKHVDTYTVTGTSYVGGLVGYAANTTVEQSYAAIKTVATGVVGGLIGYAGSDTTVTACYSSGDVLRAEDTDAPAAGFIGVTYGARVTDSYSTSVVTANQYAAGFIGTVSAGSEVTGCIGYGLVLNSEEEQKGDYLGAFAISAEGTVSDCAYLIQMYYNDAEALDTVSGAAPKKYSDLSLASNEAAQASYPYSLSLQNQSIPYAMPTNGSWNEHWGSWPEEVAIQISLVYYEQYQTTNADEPSFGVYSAVSLTSAYAKRMQQHTDSWWILNTLQEATDDYSPIVINDGYAVLTSFPLTEFHMTLYDKVTGNKKIDAASTAEALAFLDEEMIFNEAVRNETSGKFDGTYTIDGATISFSNQDYYLYNLPFDLQGEYQVNGEYLQMNSFYDKLVLDKAYYQPAGGGDPVSALDTQKNETYTFFYNPHFAKNAINPDADGRNDIDNTEDPNTIFIRSPRQFNKLGRVDYYWIDWTENIDGTKNNCLQELDIDFGKYTTTYCGNHLDLMDTSESNTYRNRPVGRSTAISNYRYSDDRSGEGFQHIYDGGNHKIIDCCISETKYQNVGVFGEINMGTIKNVILCASNADLTDGTVSSAYVKNCCTRAGENLLFNDTFVSRTGALVGYVYGVENEKRSSVVTNCSVSGYYVYAENYDDDFSYTKSSLKIGGLVGYNLGTITNCSAVCKLVQAKERDGRVHFAVGGFVGSNGYIIENCYSGGSVELIPYHDYWRYSYGIIGVFGSKAIRTIGGFAGVTLQTDEENRSKAIGFKNCYSYAAVLTPTVNDIGGTVGSSSDDSAIDDHYWRYGFGTSYEYEGLFTSSCTQTFTACYYLKSALPTGASGYDSEGQGLNYSALKDLSLSGFSKAAAANSHRWDTIGGAYPFPAIVTASDGATVHYGNWPIDGAPTALFVYYEKYSDNTTGLYYIDNDSASHNTLDLTNAKTISEAGYALLTAAGVTPADCSVDFQHVKKATDTTTDTTAETTEETTTETLVLTGTELCGASPTKAAVSGVSLTYDLIGVDGTSTESVTLSYTDLYPLTASAREALQPTLNSVSALETLDLSSPAYGSYNETTSTTTYEYVKYDKIKLTQGDTYYEKVGNNNYTKKTADQTKEYKNIYLYEQKTKTETTAHKGLIPDTANSAGYQLAYSDYYVNCGLSAAISTTTRKGMSGSNPFQVRAQWNLAGITNLTDIFGDEGETILYFLQTHDIDVDDSTVGNAEIAKSFHYTGRYAYDAANKTYTFATTPDTAGTIATTITGLQQSFLESNAGTVTCVTLSGSHIGSNGTPDTTASTEGIFVNSNKGAIRYCSVLDSSINANNDAAGFAGTLRQADNPLVVPTIENCTVGTADRGVTVTARNGAAAGFCCYISATKGSITDCSVYLSTVESAGSGSVAGFAVADVGTIQNCSAVIGTAAAGSISSVSGNAAGFVWRLYSSAQVNNCSALFAKAGSSVKAPGGTAVGFIGQLDGTKATLTNSLAKAEIGVSNASVTGLHASGFLGTNGAASGSTTTVHNCGALNLQITGTESAAGFALANKNKSEITFCGVYANNASAAADAYALTTVSAPNVAGFVLDNQNKVTSCFAALTVTGTTPAASAETASTLCARGFSGGVGTVEYSYANTRLSGPVVIGFAEEGTVSHSWALGSISTTGEAYGFTRSANCGTCYMGMSFADGCTGTLLGFGSENCSASGCSWLSDYTINYTITDASKAAKTSTYGLYLKASDSAAGLNPTPYTSASSGSYPYPVYTDAINGALPLYGDWPAVSYCVMFYGSDKDRTNAFDADKDNKGSPADEPEFCYAIPLSELSSRLTVTPPTGGVSAVSSDGATILEWTDAEGATLLSVDGTFDPMTVTIDTTTAGLDLYALWAGAFTMEFKVTVPEDIELILADRSRITVSTQKGEAGEYTFSVDNVSPRSVTLSTDYFDETVAPTNNADSALPDYINIQYWKSEDGSLLIFPHDCTVNGLQKQAGSYQQKNENGLWTEGTDYKPIAEVTLIAVLDDPSYTELHSLDRTAENGITEEVYILLKRDKKTVTEEIEENLGTLDKTNTQNADLAWTFAGWAGEKDSTDTTGFLDEDDFQYSGDAVYAVYTRTVTLNYDRNDDNYPEGTNLDPAAMSAATAAQFLNTAQTLTTGGTFNSANVTVTKNEFQKSVYNFANWSQNPDPKSQGLRYTGDGTALFAFAADAVPTATLYAQWELGTVSIYTLQQGGTYALYNSEPLAYSTTQHAYPLPNITTVTCGEGEWTFDHWTDLETGKSVSAAEMQKDHTYYAAYRRTVALEYKAADTDSKAISGASSAQTCTYDGSAVVVSSVSLTVQSSEDLTITKDYHTTSTWKNGSTEYAIADKVTQIAFTVTSSNTCTLIAVWTPWEATVHYMKQDGTEGTAPITANDNGFTAALEQLSLPAVPAGSGWTRDDGWFTASGATADPAQKTKNPGDFYAQYTRAVKIVYRADGWTGKPADTTGSQTWLGGTLTGDTTLQVSTQYPTKNFRTATGWTDDTTNNGLKSTPKTQLDFSGASDPNEVTVIPTWTKWKATLYYMGSDGSQKSVEIEADDNGYAQAVADQKLPSDPTGKGWTMDPAWYNASGTGVSLSAAQENAEFYAKYTRTISLTYSAASGWGSLPAKSTGSQNWLNGSLDGDTALTLASVTNPVYRSFTEWQCEDADIQNDAVTFSVTTPATVTVTLRWRWWSATVYTLSSSGAYTAQTITANEDGFSTNSSAYKSTVSCGSATWSFDSFSGDLSALTDGSEVSVNYSRTVKVVYNDNYGSPVDSKDYTATQSLSRGSDGDPQLTQPLTALQYTNVQYSSWRGTEDFENRSGYTFEGWTLRRDSQSGGGYYAGETIQFGVTDSASVKLYAYWTKNSGGGGGGGSCILPWTRVTLADGSQVPVKDLTGDEMLLVWNLETGAYDTAPIIFIDSDPEREYTVIHACFSDGTDVGIVSEHGFFDLDLGEYVYLDENAAQYLGHRFVKQSDTGWDTVTLTDVRVTTEITMVYSPVTYGHLCYYVDGMLSMPGGIGGLFNIFEVDTDTMTYNAEKRQADIETYGLLTVDDFGGLVSEYAFEAFNGQYLGIAVGKGLLTWETVEYLVERYAPLYDN